MSNVLKNFQDFAIEQGSGEFAKLLGISSMPVVWNANAYQQQKSNTENVAKAYPVGFMTITSYTRNPAFGHKKVSNVFQYTDGNGMKHGFTLTPIIIGMSFTLITDNYQQACTWASDLLIMREEHKSNATIAFDTLSKSTNLRVPSQMILMSDTYNIDTVEYAEDQPMEFKITGEIQLHTRASKGGIRASVLPELYVSPETDPKHASLNMDGTADELLTTSDGKVIPVRLRTNI